MRIKIEEKNRAKIIAIIQKSRGDATRHTAKIGDVFDAAKDFVSVMDKIELAKKLRKGSRYLVRTGGVVTGGYKYKRIASQFALECSTSGVFLMTFCRVELWPNDDGFARLVLTGEAVEYVTQKFYDRNSIIPIKE